MEYTTPIPIDKIIEKLKSAGIEFEQSERSITAQIKSGRDKFGCQFRIIEDVIQAMDTCDFQDFNFIKGYEAIWSEKHATIECELNTINIPPHFILRTINDIINPSASKELYSDRGEREMERIAIPFQEPIKVEIGTCSNEFALLTYSREKAPIPFKMKMDTRRRVPTLIISNIPVKTHDVASETLVKISNSIFFQLDIVAEFLITLRTERENHEERRKKGIRRRADIKNIVLGSPKYEYDSIPMSLYQWFVKNFKFSHHYT